MLRDRATQVNRPGFRGAAPLMLRPLLESKRARGSSTAARSKDVYSNRIVGYSMNDRMTSQLAVDALRNAVARRGDVADCSLHSDRGIHLRSRAMARALPRHDIVGSIGGSWRGGRQCRDGELLVAPTDGRVQSAAMGEAAGAGAITIAGVCWKDPAVPVAASPGRAKRRQRQGVSD